MISAFVDASHASTEPVLDMSDADLTQAVIWALQNPGPVLIVLGFLLVTTMALFGIVLVDSL